MAEQVLIDVGIWIAGVSYAGVSNSVGVKVSADTPEKTVFKGGWRTRAEGGLKTSAFSLEGFFDTVITDEAQFASLGTERSVMVVPAGMTPGDVAYIVPVAVSGHQLSGSVGDLLAFTYAAEGDGPAVRAQMFGVREGVDSAVTIQRKGLFPSVTPAIGDKIDVWLHVERTSAAGTMQVELRSSATQTGGTTITRDTVGITDTGLYMLSYTIPDPPITQVVFPRLRYYRGR